MASEKIGCGEDRMIGLMELICWEVLAEIIVKLLNFKVSRVVLDRPNEVKKKNTF